MKTAMLRVMGLGAILSMSAVASAATIQITFNDTDGVATSLWDGTNGSAAQEAFGGSNTGNDSLNRAYLTLPRENDGWPAALYRANLPADFAGATVNSATFKVRDAFFNGGGPTANVQLRRINLPGSTPWDPGTGTRGDRFTTPDNGALMFWADFDVANDNGVDWAGNTVAGPWNGGSATDFRTTALADLIDSQEMASGTDTTWNVLTLAQNWASGVWENDGFALSTLLAAGNTSGYQLQTTGGDSPVRGLVIDYTPIPEPASLSLLALGGVAMLRRRSR
jgi:hypothetical protein